MKPCGKEEVEDVETVVEAQEEVAAGVEPAKTKLKTTPLSMRQMIPMTFVLLSESLCQTMLLPIVGLLVAHLRNAPKEEAGYVSGILVAAFMIGQVTSGKAWGWLSDKYGRRFPLISGLFTSGIMMMGFGLSGSVWTCAVFRFLHGLFNGNVLVAKTMMADITDKTNQAQGFAFVSFTYGLGSLAGPALGGLLYDPTSETSAMHFLGLDPNGIFARRPALLPSLVICFYTTVGMTVCTFLVQESNPHAKPLPPLLKFLYPCLLVPAKTFVKPPLVEEVDEQAEGSRSASATGVADASCTESGTTEDCGGVQGDRSRRRLRTFLREDARMADDVLIVAESEQDLPHGCEVAPPSPSRARNVHDGENSSHSNRSSKSSHSNDSNSVTGSGKGGMDRVKVGDVLGTREELQRSSDTTSSTSNSNSNSSGNDKTGATTAAALPPVKHVRFNEEEDVVAVPPAGSVSGRADGEFALEDVLPGSAQVSSPTRGGGTYVLTFRQFGYKQAFSYPPTRFLLCAFMLLSGGCMCVDEALPLWLISSKSVGGLDYTSTEVGYVMMANSVPTIASNMVFHIVCRRFEDKMQLFRIGVFLCGLSFFVLPFASYLPYPWMQATLVVLCSCTRMFFSAWGYSIITMLTAVAAPKKHVGSVLGVNQSVGCLTRGIVPIFIAYLFALSISSPHIPPFNHMLTFFIGAAVLWADCLWSMNRYTNDAGELFFTEKGALQQCVQWVKEKLSCCSGN